MNSALKTDFSLVFQNSLNYVMQALTDYCTARKSRKISVEKLS